VLYGVSKEYVSQTYVFVFFFLAGCTLREHVIAYVSSRNQEYLLFVCLSVPGATAPSGSWPPHSRGF